MHKRHDSNDLGNSPEPPAAREQRPAGIQRRIKSSNGDPVLDSADYVKHVWPQLPPHICDAILTLVDPHYRSSSTVSWRGCGL